MLGCNYNPNNSNYLPPSVVWSKSDEMPSFKECDEFNTNSERKTCFESKILNMIYSNLDLNEIVVSQKINDRIGSSELDFFKKVREGYLQLSEKFNENFLVIDATLDLTDNLKTIYKWLELD